MKPPSIEMQSGKTDKKDAGSNSSTRRTTTAATNLINEAADQLVDIKKDSQAGSEKLIGPAVGELERCLSPLFKSSPKLVLIGEDIEIPPGHDARAPDFFETGEYGGNDPSAMFAVVLKLLSQAVAAVP
ncbi:MAG: hypothetical protein Q9179_007778 [Wetmoreana sp. 5 TL-2023]